MRQDILIATSMVLGSVIVLLAIVASVARATREPAEA
jgi:preprotein translocase subunit SecE